MQVLNYFDVPALSSSFVKFISTSLELHGKLIDYEKEEPSKSLVLGTVIHEIIETKGESLNQLKEKKELFRVVENPASELNADLFAILQFICDGYDYDHAYFKVRVNESTKNCEEYYFTNVIPLSDEEIKKRDKVRLLAFKDFKKVEPYIESFKKYKEDLLFNENLKVPEYILKNIDAIESLYNEVKVYLENWKGKIYREKEIYIKINGVPCKIKVDYMIEFEDSIVIIDFKTMSDHVNNFAVNYKKYKYYYSGSFYKIIVEKYFNKPVINFTMLAISFSSNSIKSYKLDLEELSNIYHTGIFIHPFKTFNFKNELSISVDNIEKLSETLQLPISNFKKVMSILEIIEYARQNTSFR